MQHIFRKANVYWPLMQVGCGLDTVKYFYNLQSTSETTFGGLRIILVTLFKKRYTVIGCTIQKSFTMQFPWMRELPYHKSLIKFHLYTWWGVILLKQIRYPGAWQDRCQDVIKTEKHWNISQGEVDLWNSLPRREWRLEQCRYLKRKKINFWWIRECYGELSQKRR